MTKNEFYVLNNLYDASIGRAQSTTDVFLNRAILSRDTVAQLITKGCIDKSSGELTSEGRKMLEPYRVESAVILAAGSATRFIPLSLEQPKGLYEVRGERLIERQIQQLQEAGIRDITIVLGYKKDMFVYLKEKYSVRLLFNPAYNVKNNIESLLVAKKYIGNSYICVCDSYYKENPFHTFEYDTFYTGFSTTESRLEMYARIGTDGRILEMERGLEGGMMLLGHSFWKWDFSRMFFQLAEKDREIGRYDKKYWEWLVKDYLNKLPSIYFKEYVPGAIQEFDYFEQLREFDPGYVSHAHSDIIRNIKLVFRCDEEDVVEFRTVSEGLTNTSFIFRIGEEDYIYRHPGDGTEHIINRRNEKTSLIKARELGIDPTYIYMDINEGWKISRFIHQFREPDYGNFEDSKKVIRVLRKLHSSSVKVDYGLRPWEDSLSIEQLLKEKDASCFVPYETLKQKVGALYRSIEDDGVEKCFCHGDTYKPNWMIEPDGNVILIDWEYSGFADPGIDVGYYIVDAMYEPEEALRFIREYLQEGRTKQKEYHFLVYTALIAYYWFVWAMYRKSCGADMEESLENWHKMAERYVSFLEPESV